MRPHLPKTKGVLTALMAGAAVLCWSAASLAASPLLAPDCGTGAAVVGSDVAGKVTIGTPDPTIPSTGTCTLEFSVPPLNPPACSAVNETNGGGFPAPMGTKTTTTTLMLGSSSGWIPGDVVTYSCVGY
jgi:hypothetical protein